MFRDIAEIQRYQAAGAAAQNALVVRLSSDIALLDEMVLIMNLAMKHLNHHFYAPSLSSEIAFMDPVVTSTISPRVARFLSKFQLIGAVDSVDSDNFKFQVLNSYGQNLCNSTDYRHAIFGPKFTLEAFRSAVSLLVVGENLESGSTVHIGNGQFLTCAHCVKNEYEGLAIHYQDLTTRTSDVKVLHQDTSVDVAVLVAPELAWCPSVPLASTVTVLDSVMALHYPNAPSIERALISTTGEVVGRSLNFLRGKLDDCLTSARTAPGSSGGAIINDHGRLAGLIVGSGSSVESTDANADSGLLIQEPFYHFIPVEQIRDVLQQAGLN